MSDHHDAIADFSGLPKLPAGSAAVPDHTLLRLIGRGSYGEVWLARNTLGSFRAIKIVFEKTFRDKRPFEREFNGVRKFEPISRLHEGLMDVLQVGRNDEAGYFYCVMELADDVVSGQAIDPENYSPRTLAQDLAKHQRLPIADCRRIGVDIASALEFLHRSGLIHRDVKPSNIVFVNGVPKLADVGLVAETSAARSYVGTEGFIPPEGPGTAQADIYSFGKVLYEISTGNDRHDYPEFPAELDNAAEQESLFEFTQIVVKACRTEPRDRYASAAALVGDLLKQQNPNGSRLAKRWLRPAIWGVTAVALAFGLKNYFQERSSKPEGLVSWWDADGSARDRVGGNHGKFPGDGSVTYGPGVSGKAFVFDGFHRDGVNVGASASLHPQNLTIEAWIKRTSATNVMLESWGHGGSIFSFGHLGCTFYLATDGRLVFGKLDSWGIYSTNAISDTDWHHVAFSRSGTNVAFYIDGLLDSVAAVTDTNFQFDTAAAIGTRGDFGGGTFFGSIDELALYRRALSAAEIETIYRAGSEGARPPPVPPSSDGLIAAWPAEGDAEDSVGKHRGILVNGATFASGKVGKAFHFDGKNQYVKVPWSPDLDVGKEVTIEFWVKADPGNSMHSFQGLVAASFYVVSINSGYYYKSGISFAISTDGGKTVTPHSFPDTAEANQGGIPVTAGEWHHIAGIYDGTRLQLYVDGRPAGKPMRHSGAISPMATNSFLAFGCEDGRYSLTGEVVPKVQLRYFEGLIDEIRLYRRALSAGEIRFIYEAGASGKPVAFVQRP